MGSGPPLNVPTLLIFRFPFPTAPLLNHAPTSEHYT